MSELDRVLRPITSQKRVREVVDIDISITHVPARTNDIEQSEAVLSDARELLGYEQTMTLGGGLRETLNSEDVSISYFIANCLLLKVMWKSSGIIGGANLLLPDIGVCFNLIVVGGKFS